MIIILRMCLLFESACNLSKVPESPGSVLFYTAHDGSYNNMGKGKFCFDPSLLPSSKFMYIVFM